MTSIRMTGCLLEAYAAVTKFLSPWRPVMHHDVGVNNLSLNNAWPPWLKTPSPHACSPRDRSALIKAGTHASLGCTELLGKCLRCCCGVAFPRSVWIQVGPRPRTCFVVLVQFVAKRNCPDVSISAGRVWLLLRDGQGLRGELCVS